MKYLRKFENNAAYKSATLDLPNVAYCEEENEVHYNPIHDYSQDYLTTVALENGTISFNIQKSMGTNMITSISYSKDNGNTWTTTNNVDNKSEHLAINVSVNEGDEVLWKGNATQTGYYDEYNYADYVGSFFSSTCEFDAKGNVMSLLYGDDFKGETTIEESSAFCRLFNDYDGEKICSIVNTKNLSLPATTLSQSCYKSMFKECISLTTAPKLPATTLTYEGYQDMFWGCTSLTIAPELPATTLANNCYQGMFDNCTGLTIAPELPATTLASGCYSEMFYDCTSLITAPSVLPATTLADGCYSSMFEGCTSLTTAPELLATTLIDNCYRYMFYRCISLNYIKAMFTTTPSSTYTENWVSGVAATGTFVKNSAAQWNVSGNNGIPTGWTVETASE